MSEEKKDDNFLDGHAELLSSIKKKNADAEAAEEAAPVVEETPEASAAEETAPVQQEPEAAEEKPAPEPAEVEEPEVPTIEETPVPEPVEVEEPDAVAEEVEPTAKEEETVTEEPVETEEPAIGEDEVTEQHLIAEVPPVVEEVPVKKPKPKKKPATPEEAKKQKHDALEHAEVKEVLGFINKYVKPAGFIIVAVCIVFLGFSFIQNGKAKKLAEADNLLTSAKTAADYQHVLDNYGNTPSAPLAMLGLAQKKFNKGDVAGAEALYGEFLNTYAKHQNALQAKLNKINCIEAQGRFEDAAGQYAAFQSSHEKSHLAPVALMGAARCRESAGDLTGAKQAYEDLIAFYEDTGWVQEAAARLSIVNAKIK